MESQVQYEFNLMSGVLKIITEYEYIIGKGNRLQERAIKLNQKNEPDIVSGSLI
jgi:hypothetical protein